MGSAKDVLRLEEARARRESLIANLLLQIRAAGLPEPEREVVFAPPRRWRFDGAWKLHWVAFEVQGGTYAQGRHTRGRGYAEDCRKHNTAIQLGWAVFLFPRDLIESGEAIVTLERQLK